MEIGSDGCAVPLASLAGVRAEGALWRLSCGTEIRAMIRCALPGEETRLETFLARYPETSMFLRSNLADHGLGESSHSRATTYWLSECENGEITAVLGRNNFGFLMAQAPNHSPQLWQGFALMLGGKRVAGMTGEAGQVAAGLEGLGLAEACYQLNQEEPLYRLDLARLRDPEAKIRPPEERDLPLLRDWFSIYFEATGLAADGATARAQAMARADCALGEGNMRLLIEEGVPVAMAGINAEVAGMVQVGGVYVPQDARNRGLGRRVTAALLAEHRARGAQTAILFSNNDAASRAYESIGFVRVGSYQMAMLAKPQVLGVTA